MVGVVGSNPIAPTNEYNDLGRLLAAFFVPERAIGESLGANLPIISAQAQPFFS